MSTIIYPAIVSGDAVKGYHAALPDLPAVSIDAAAVDELLRLAREQVLQALKALEDAGEAWPAPTPLDRVREGLSGTDYAVFMVDVQVEDPPVRVNISIGERLLQRIDAAAEAENMTRSGFLAAAARQRLGEDTTARGRAADAAQRLYDEVIAAGRRVNDTLGPDSAVGRTLAELDARALDGLRQLAKGVSSAVGRRPEVKAEASRSAPDPAQAQADAREPDANQAPPG